jgi:tRNA-2-methylthio-N6-dimethylallyladenosine synthase
VPAGDAPVLPLGRFLAILDEVRAAIPDAAISTDIIVGFPGETDDDFAATLDVVEQARFAQAFTFQYSPRPGTPAATLPDQLPKAVVQERYERLVALQEEISWQQNRALGGRTVEVLVATGRAARTPRPGGCRAGPATGRLGALHAGGRAGTAGRRVTVAVTYGAPHHLVADGPLLTHRRTRAGDAHEAGHARPGGRRRGWACRASARRRPCRRRHGCGCRPGEGRDERELAGRPRRPGGRAGRGGATRRAPVDPGPTALPVAVGGAAWCWSR